MHCSNKKTSLYFKTVLAVMVVLVLLQVSVAGAAEVQSHKFRMISTVEYSGKGQYRNQAESVFSVEKELLVNDMVNYTIWSSTPGLFSDTSGGSSNNKLTFVVDRSNHRILGESKQSEFLENVNNQCVRSFKKVSKADIGKSWEQTFKLSVPYCEFPEELTFKLKAIGLSTEAQGESIAVRATSQPFTLTLLNNEAKEGQVKCRIGSVYLFDSSVEDIYMSISVFEATTKMNGYKEEFRNEIATYRLDSNGKSIDLKGLSKDFEKLVRKIKLSPKELKVKEEVPLPQWIRSQVIHTARAANICAATACEGAVNPVATIFAASSRMIGLQGAGLIRSAQVPMTVSKALVQTVPGVGSMKIATAPFLGLGMAKVGAIAGGTAGGVAAGGGGGGSSSAARSD